MSLLNKAKAHKKPAQIKSRKFSAEELELAVAWILGEVALRDVNAVKKIAGSMSGYLFILLALRYGVSEGLISVKLKK